GLARLDLDTHARENARAIIERQTEHEPAGRYDLDIFAGMFDTVAFAPLHETEWAGDTRVDLDVRDRSRRGCEQPLARDFGIEPCVEDALRRFTVARFHADRSGYRDDRTRSAVVPEPRRGFHAGARGCSRVAQVTDSALTGRT